MNTTLWVGAAQPCAPTHLCAANWLGSMRIQSDLRLGLVGAHGCVPCTRPRRYGIETIASNTDNSPRFRDLRIFLIPIPTFRICNHVVGDSIECLFVANHVLVEPALPDAHARRCLYGIDSD